MLSPLLLISASLCECLEILGCVGRGKVNKLAEIIAGVALAGEISLAAAISILGLGFEPRKIRAQSLLIDVGGSTPEGATK